MDRWAAAARHAPLLLFLAALALPHGAGLPEISFNNGNEDAGARPRNAATLALPLAPSCTAPGWRPACARAACLSASASTIACYTMAW
jgi:hypothetical protein